MLLFIDRVKTFKLLGVHVSDDLKWSHHIDGCNLLQGCISSTFYEATRTVWRLAGGLGIHLQLSRALDPGVRLSGLALKPHCGSCGRPGVNSEASDVPYVPSGLQDVNSFKNGSIQQIFHSSLSK